MQSIIQTDKVCYLCGSVDSLQLHHCIHGNNRSRADKDGLTVWLCVRCHTNLHQRGWNDMALKRIAEAAWCRRYGSEEDFIKRYGKSYK